MQPNEPQKPSEPTVATPPSAIAPTPAYDAPIAPTPAPQQPHATQPQGKPSKMPVVAMVLAIFAFVIGLFWFISVPVAIAALIVGIIALVKKYSKMGFSIAAVSIAGLTLMIAPFWIALTIAIYTGIQEAARERRSDSSEIDNGINSGPVSDATTVRTECYSYDVPEYYTEADEAREVGTCVSGIMLAEGGDALTAIAVHPITDSTYGTVEDRQAYVRESLEKQDVTISSLQSISANGNETISATYEDSFGLERVMHYIYDKDASHESNGSTIYGYQVSGYAYNDALRGTISEVLDSFTIN